MVLASMVLYQTALQTGPIRANPPPGTAVFVRLKTGGTRMLDHCYTLPTRDAPNHSVKDTGEKKRAVVLAFEKFWVNLTHTKHSFLLPVFSG